MAGKQVAAVAGQTQALSQLKFQVEIRCAAADLYVVNQIRLRMRLKE